MKNILIKKHYLNLNPDEIDVYGATLVPYLDLKIQDIISKQLELELIKEKSVILFFYL